MVLGLLPSIRDGLGTLARTGQDSRLIDGYLRPYARAFDEVRYFSYLRESLAQYTDDSELLARVRVFPGGGWHPWMYQLLLPLRHAPALRTCSVVRVFQVLGALPAVIAKRRYGVPLVTTYGFWYEALARSRTRGLLRRVVSRVGLRAADAVIVTTPELGAYVARRVGPAKVALIPNGVDTARFAPSPRTPSTCRRLLYIGRLSEEKNLEVLLEATAELLRRFDVSLTLVGTGPRRDSLEALGRSRGVPVTFVPSVDHREVPGYLRDADVFVLPSRTEGHPKVLLEAMSAGVPCVASDVDGNRAIVTDGVTGLLFDPGDAGALAACVSRLFTDPALACAVGVRARGRVLEQYDLARLVAAEIALLRRVARPA